ncbi:uncharacterized protein LOC109845925 [Asparagus officinalis]|uniref:uncharacterized protein LOC109845925 n=1 Tax=Asparagus officinalis TaxID=4686 RepID=UPI00098E11F8|nr:uncharacterized protein LOC109845925 [Asparagus officinalis]
MVVGKVMRWSPWAPSSSSSSTKKKKEKKTERFDATMTVAKVEGLGAAMFGEGSAVAFTVRRARRTVGFTREAAVRADGVAEFREGDNGFGRICYGSGGDLEVSFCVSHGTRDESKRQKEKKLEEIGTETVSFSEWFLASQSTKKKSQFQAQRKRVPIILVKDGLTAEAILHVDVSFRETRKPEKKSETPAFLNKEEEEEETTDDSSTFNSNSLELSQLLSLTDETEKPYECKNRIRTANTNSSNPSTSSSSVSSSPELHLQSSSKRRFFPWGRRKIGNKRYDDEEVGSRKTQPSSNCSPQSKETVEPNDTWVSKEIISRDGQTKLKSKTFFASIDQRDESAGGESACTALVAVIADALLSKQDYVPNRLEFDNLIKEGSVEWQKLCNNTSYINRFHNKHFDLDTILEANIRDISVLSEKSFVGFFQPESFESLCGAMSFDDIWNEITSDIGGEPRIYIISWNDHFFVLKVETDSFYIIDTLGERLFEGCTKAYMLKFDDFTEMYRVSEKGEEDELICTGKECCREFIKRFLAAIPLREELELEEKGTGNPNTALHQRLQIEFHLTQASSKAFVVDDIDWFHLTQASSNALVVDDINWW